MFFVRWMQSQVLETSVYLEALTPAINPCICRKSVGESVAGLSGMAVILFPVRIPDVAEGGRSGYASASWMQPEPEPNDSVPSIPERACQRALLSCVWNNCKSMTTGYLAAPLPILVLALFLVVQLWSMLEYRSSLGKW